MGGKESYQTEGSILLIETYTLYFVYNVCNVIEVKYWAEWFSVLFDWMKVPKHNTMSVQNGLFPFTFDYSVHCLADLWVCFQLILQFTLFSRSVGLIPTTITVHIV